MSYARELINNKTICKSIVGIDPPVFGHEVEINQTREAFNDDLSLSEINDKIEQYKEDHFDELNMIGSFFRVNWNQDSGIITISVVVFILDEEQANEFSKRN